MNETAVKKTVEEKDPEPTFIMGAVMQKRIWSDLNARDFNSFRERGRAEGFKKPDGKTDIGAVLNNLAVAYAHGEIILPDKYHPKKVHPKNPYLEDHKKQSS